MASRDASLLAIGVLGGPVSGRDLALLAGRAARRGRAYFAFTVSQVACKRNDAADSVPLGNEIVVVIIVLR